MKNLFLLSIIAVISFSFISKKDKIKDVPEFNYIPAGAVSAFDSVVTNHAFFISTTEITSKQYSIFLNELKANNDRLNYNQANDVILIDDTPISNISYEAAVAYCKWLEDKINNQEVVIKDLFKNKDKKFKVSVTLPNKAEWVAASKSSVNSKFYWGKSNEQPDVFCNYRKIKPEEIYYEDNLVKYNLNDELHNTNKVSSLKPNDYGLYDMSGNVAEMIIEKGLAMGGSYLDGLSDCSTESFQEYTTPQQNIGFRPIITLVGERKILKSGIYAK